MFVVCVTFEIKPDQLDQFLPLMHENAKLSLELEPDCHRFDVCQGSARANSIFLYELYSTQADFELHLKMDHFLEFNEATSQMVADKKVETHQLLER